MTVTSSKVKQAILQITVLLSLLFIIIVCLWTSWRVIATLSSQVAAAIIVGAAIILVSVLSVLWSKRHGRLREIEQEHRKQKIPVYEEFMALLFKIVMAEKLGNEPVSDKEMIQFFVGFAQRLIV